MGRLTDRVQLDEYYSLRCVQLDEYYSLRYQSILLLGVREPATFTPTWQVIMVTGFY